MADKIRLIPDDILAAISDEDFASLWGDDRRLKPFYELPKHLQEMPGIKELY